MKNKKFLKVFSSAMALSLVVAGCSTGSSSSSKKEGELKSVEFKTGVENAGTAVKDATFKLGVVSPSAMDMNFSQFAKNSTVNSSTVQQILYGESAIAQDSKYKFLENDPSAPFQIKVDRDKKTLTYKVTDGVTWSNGKPVTAKDIVATYEMALTEEVQYLFAEPLANIVGAEEYFAKKADKISGIKEVDEKTVEIQLKEVKPSIYFGDGLFQRFENAEQIAAAKKDLGKLADSELNTKPLSYGPYVLDKVQPGEAVTYKANEHFWKKDEVKTKNVELKRVTPDQASQVIKAGEVDTLDVTEDMYDTVKDLKNGTILGQAGTSYSYVGFKLGKFEKAGNGEGEGVTGKVVTNKDSKLADPKVREAFAISVDWDKLNAVLYKGLRTTPTGSGYFPPAFDYITDANATGYKFDKEKAKKLLDEAGLKDTNGDGIREDKNGKELSFNFLARKYASESEQTSQARVDEALKAWKEVGLNVKQLDSKLYSSTEAWPRINADDPQIDLFDAGLRLGTNPNNVVGNFSSTSPENYSRFTSAELDKLAETANSNEMFDDAKFVETYRAIDKQLAAQHLAIPVNWNKSLTFVNSRVKNYDVKKISKGDLLLHQLELTADKPAQG